MAGNMRNNIAMVTALILGVHCCLPGMVAKAEEKTTDAADMRTDNGSIELADRYEGNVLQGNLGFEDFPEGILGNQKFLMEYRDTLGENTNAVHRGMPGTSDISGAATDTESESDGIDNDFLENADKNLQDMDNKNNGSMIEKESLQMPQKLEVVIDPWEMDGKGQIYSEKYVIQNTGEETGILVLSGLTCKPREKSGAVVRTDRAGIHDDKTKSIYMEMLFSTGERIVLSEEGDGYEAELKPGEEVSLQFAGEVNEYASGSWDNGDITVGVVYSWNIKEDKADTSGDAVEPEEESEKSDKSGDVSGDISREKQGDISGDKSGDVSGDISGEKQGDISGDKSGDVSGDISLRTVDLDSPEDAEIGADPWAVNADGKSVPMWYVLRNTGGTAGTLTLLEPVCIGAGQDEFTVRMIPYSDESLQESETLGLFDYMEQRKAQDAEGREKYVLIDFIPKDEERQTDGEENWEISEYQVELKPGEEIVVCFSVGVDGLTPKELESEKASVKATYSWVLGGKASGEYED